MRDQFFVGDKGYGVDLNFNIFIFPLIKAQPEHKHRFSTGADLGLADAKNRIVIFVFKQGMQLFSHFTVQ